MTAAPDWSDLRTRFRRPLVDVLEQLWTEGSFGIDAAELADKAHAEFGVGFSHDEAKQLLDGAGSWLEAKQEVLDPEEGDNDQGFTDVTPKINVRYVYHGGRSRRIPWIVMIHGMNTTGTWQQHLAFDLAVGEGKAPPIFIVKYGRVIVGAVLRLRRKMLVRNLRKQLVQLIERSVALGLGQRPDVIAHSLGTWILGHLLLGELDKPADERLAVGRVILTGSVLRPDFPWNELQADDLVADVLNHYATADKIVPLAHFTIPGSGPSGRRGFNPMPGGRGDRNTVVLNVAADGAGHSDLLNPPPTEANAILRDVWMPFLTNPAGEAGRHIATAPPTSSWRAKPWPIRRGR